jgi:ABC-type uncharacterized transport system permease subunit
VSRWATAIALPLGLLAILCLTLIVLKLPLGDSLRLLYEGALGDKYGIHRTILKSVPLILVAFGVIVAWKGGMFNIGGEGQLVCGVCAGAGAARLAAGLSWPLSTALILLACCAAGGIYAGIAAWLHVKRGVNVVISTILLNFVALQLMSYLVRGPLQEAAKKIPQSEPVVAGSMFPVLDPQTGLHGGVFLVPVVAVLVWLWVFRSPSGFRLRLVGANPHAARAAGIPVVRTQATALIWSGALCGLAGGVEYLGVSGYLFDGFSPGWGFLGIPVALVGGLHPFGVLLSGLYFGALFAGSKNLEAFGAASSTLVFMMQGVAVLGFVGLHAMRGKRLERVG